MLVPELRDADAAAFTSMQVAVAAITVALMVAGMFNHASFVIAAFAWSLTAQVALAVRN
ncbi:hypothetical protein ACXZ66_14065 (plasmid) [Corynebacterium sp. S7]